MNERIDFHSHILPGADHGSDSLKTSLAQLSFAKAAGVDTVVATPHFYPAHDTMGEFLSRREETSAELAANKPVDSPRIALGSEVHLCAGLDHMDGLDQLCIAGTNVILLELPFRHWNDAVMETVLAIQDSGEFTPVLAHVDRYPPSIVEMLFSYNIPGQLNVASICRLRHRSQLLLWAKAGNIVALGSDIHQDINTYAKFPKAERLLEDSYASIMASTAHLLEGAKYI